MQGEMNALLTEIEVSLFWHGLSDVFPSRSLELCTIHFHLQYLS